MRNIRFVVLNLLLVVIVAPAQGQTLAEPCGEAQVIELEHGQPITLDYQPGLSVTLAGDTEGKAELRGRSVVGIEFSSGHKLGYGVEPLPVTDLAPLLVEGSNTIRLTAVDIEHDTAWIIVEAPCSAVVAMVPTATRVLIPTPTPLSIAVVQPLTETVPVADDGTSIANAGITTAFNTLMRRAAQVLIAGTLLGLILLLTMADLKSWLEGLVRRASAWKQWGGRTLLAQWKSLEVRLLAWRKRKT